MDEQGKGLAMVVLGIVAVIAVVGLVLLFSRASATGNYVMGSEFSQFQPAEACERMGCTLKSVDVGPLFRTSRSPLAICDCAGQEVETFTSRPFNWREEYYPQG